MSETVQYGQERRLVTVLFADFVGFTTLSEELDAEVLQELVSGIFEDLAEQAVAHDGTIEKFIGDAIFVIFGAPIAHEDDPQRALRTALAMHKVFGEHAARAKKDRGIELGLRIGVHSGIVVAGNVRSVAEYGVMGDTVNTAARLQEAAPPGETYVTQTTFRLTNREFTFREVGPIEMRGKEKPVLAYALTGERSDIRVAIELNAPLVGRWMELSRLDLAYQSVRTRRRMSPTSGSARCTSSSSTSSARSPGRGRCSTCSRTSTTPTRRRSTSSGSSPRAAHGSRS